MNNYLEKLKLYQVHIYDSDIGSRQPNKYKKYIDIDYHKYFKAFFVVRVNFSGKLFKLNHFTSANACGSLFIN